MKWTGGRNTLEGLHILGDPQHKGEAEHSHPIKSSLSPTLPDCISLTRSQPAPESQTDLD